MKAKITIMRDDGTVVAEHEVPDRTVCQWWIPDEDVGPDHWIGFRFAHNYRADPTVFADVDPGDQHDWLDPEDTS